MISRERIITALEHKEPDRVPVDLGGWSDTGIAAIAYRDLRRFLGIKDGIIRIYDPVQQLAQPEEQVLRRVGADVLFLFNEPEHWKPYSFNDGSLCEVPEVIDYVNTAPFEPSTLPDGSRVILDDSGNILFKMPKDGWYYDPVYRPLAQARDAKDIERYPWPNPKDPGIIKKLRNLACKAEDLYKNTDYLITMDSGGSVFEIPCGYRGFENFLTDLITNQKLAEMLMDKFIESQMEMFEAAINVVGQYVQVVQMTEDLGIQDGPIISPDLYRNLIKPRQKKLCEFIKSKTDAYICLHSCGSIYEFIPDFIEIGVDILDPIQLSAKNMDTRKLKKEFGKELVFWGGGCDTQRVLPFGTPKEVKEEVKKRIDDLAPGGGFIFSQVHNIQAGVPPQNIMAMYEAVEEFGQY